jgi:hypothetical protein
MASRKQGSTSAKQVAANRRNATRSTGPKSSEGKERVRLNALKHGLLAKDVVLPGEDAESFRVLSDRMFEDLEPEGELEAVLVGRIVAGLWRLRRLQRVEAGVYANEVYEATRDRDDRGKRPDDVALRAAWNPSPAPSDEEREDAIEGAGIAEWGAAFVRDSEGVNAFSKLSRYETTIERSVFGSLHELQRVQAARISGADTTPVAADVSVSVSGE